MALGSTTLGQLAVKLVLNDQSFKAGMSRAEKQTQQTGSSMGKFAGKLDGIVTRGFQAASAAAIGFAGATAVVGARFEQAITTVAALSTDGMQNIGALEDQARELGATTAFSATQAADAMKSFAQAGMTATQIIEASRPALLLAGAAGTDMSVATAGMTATMKQFGLETTDAGRVSDVFSMAMRTSLFDLQGLSDAMKYGGTVGAGFGMSLEQTTASLAQFRNLGLEATQAGTNFRMAMIKAARVTSKGAAILDKYGLSAADINPELNSFAEIMQKVGDAGISTTETIELFGSRAGANVAQIASQFRDGTTSFFEMEEGLRNSAGSTEEVYGQMMDTVSGQFAIAKSAFEELMLSVFDTYGDDLKAFLTELASTISYIAMHFQRTSDGVGDDLGSMLRGWTEWLSENQAEAAVAFQGFISSMVSMIKMFAKILPLLDDIAKALLLIWFTGKVMAFTSALMGIAGAAVAAGGGVAGLATALAVASGGIIPLIAGVSALVLGLGAMIVGSHSAASAARELAEAEDAAAAAAEDAAARRHRAAGNLNQAGQAWSRETELRLEGSGNLSSALRTELQAIQNLTDAQVAQKISSGEMVEMFADGERHVVSVALAMELATGQTEMAMDAYNAMDDALANANNNLENAEQNLTRHQDRIVDYNDDVNASSADHIVWAQTLGRTFDSMGAVIVHTTTLNNKIGEQTRLRDGLASAMAREEQIALRKSAAAQAAQNELAANGGRTSEQIAADGEAASKRWLAAYKSAHDARLKLMSDLTAEVESSNRAEVDVARAAMEERLRLVRETFDVEMQLVRRNAERRAELTAALAVAEAQVVQVAQREANDKTVELEGQLRDSLRAIVQTESQAMAAQYETRRLAAVALYDSEASLAEAGSDEVLAIQARREAALTALTVEENTARAQLLIGQQRTVQDSIDSMRLAAAKETANAVELVEIERIEAIAAAEGASGQQIAAINEIFDARRSAASDQMIAESDEVAENAEENAKTVGEAWMSAFSAVGAAIKKMASAATQAFASFTGFEFDMAGSVSSLSDQKSQAAADGEDFNTADAATSMVTDQVDGAIQMVETWVEAAPALMQALIDELPKLFMAVVDAVPLVITSLMDALPELIGVLAAGIVSIVEMLPEIIDQIMQKLPDIITALFEAIDDILLALFEAIPKIIMSIIDALPAILIALVEGLVNVIMTIAEQMPILITKIIEMIPMLFEAILEALPEIIIMLTEAVPLIITGIISSLPRVIMALILLVPQLIAALVRALPEITVALVKGLWNLMFLGMGDLVGDFLVKLWEGLKAGTSKLMTIIWEAITGALDKGKDAVGNFFGGIWDGIKDGASAVWEGLTGWMYSGIDYVPSTMRVTLHQGEAVVPADRNPANQGGGTNPAGAGVMGGAPMGGGGSAPIDIAIMAEGRLLDAVQVTSLDRGHAPKMERKLRMASGVRAGFNRGKFNPWSG